MKNGLHMNQLLFKMVVLVTCIMLVMLYNKSKAADVCIKRKAEAQAIVMR